jgi:hypothetical protein
MYGRTMKAVREKFLRGNPLDMDHLENLGVIVATKIDL